MSSKDLYEEEDLNEDVEEEDDEDEIIDNDDGGFEESIVVQENKAKKEEKEEEKTIPQEKMKQTETELDKYSKEDLLNILLNNPVNAQGTIEHDDNKEVNINISEANQKVKNLSPEGEEADFDTALTKILSQMVKDPNKKIKGNENELYDILLCDREVIENELNKINFSKKVNMSEKIKTYLDKKEKKLKTIEEKVNQEFNKKYTFAPVINTGASTINPNVSQIAAKKRNLNEFLKDQENYQKKIEEKRSQLKDSQDRKAIEELKLKPQICNTSKKIVQEKFKGEEVYKRLYNKPQVKVEKEKEVKKVSASVNTEKFNTLYEEAKIREKRNKEKETIENRRIKESLVYKTNTNSNKYLLKKFKAQFKEQIEGIILSSNNSNKFTFDQLKTLYTNLHFLSQTKLSSAKNDIEVKLFNSIYENLKDENGLMKIDHIFIFSLSIINLLEYYIMSNYQSTNTSNQITDVSASASQKTLTTVKSTSKIMSKNNSVNNVGLNKKSTSPDETYNLYSKINNDLSSRIVDNKKYGGFDKNGNFIITLTQGKLISKDFASFYQNYSYKPTVANNSAVKQRQNNQLSSNKKSHSKSKSINHSNNQVMNRIQQLYQESAKKKNMIEKEMEKYQQEKEKEELKLCTFKPKINQNSHYKNNIFPVDESLSTPEKRIEMLYKKGTESLLSKKDKTRNEMEIEKYQSECTFKPETHEVKYEIFDKEKSIYQDDDLMKFNQRLKKGRDEREYRESALERGEFLLRPRGKSEGKIFKPKNDLNSTKTLSNNSSVSNIRGKRSFVESTISSTNNGPVVKKSFIHKENEVPLLEIDVNLKHGVKKKILVYDGDTAEDLATVFSEENSKLLYFLLL